MILIFDGNSQIGMEQYLFFVKGIWLDQKSHNYKNTFVPSYVRNMFWVTILYKYTMCWTQHFYLG